MTPRRIDSPIGMAEIAELSNISVARIKQLRAEHRFPEPDGLLKMGPWWWRATIDEWMQIPRPTGRPKGRSDSNGS